MRLLTKPGIAVAGSLSMGVCVCLVPISANAINDGVHAETCAFPAVARLFGTRSYLSCSASYIGGRVIITAAHCFDFGGYALDQTLLSSQTGVAVPHCESDADCQSVTIAGEIRPLTCHLNGDAPNGVTIGECYLDDPEFNNDSLEVYFGEIYDPAGRLHPGVVVPVRYCHINPGFVTDPNDDSQDFAYCILAEEPDIQPVPLLMQCEVERYLTQDYDLDVLVAGFGVANGESETVAGRPGRKRWAWSSTDGAVMLPDDTSFSTALFAPFEPGLPMEGDSGGPLLVRLPSPNEGWRLVGVYVKSLLLAPAWNYVEWMLEDPEVDASAILPCHDALGNWQPGPNCGGFPQTPWMGEGSWLEGAHACESSNISQQSSACGPVFRNPGSPLTEPGPSPLSLEPAAPTIRPDTTAIACTLADDARIGPSALLLALAGLLRRRRRRTAQAIGSLVLCSLTACSDEVASSNSQTGGDTGGPVDTGGPQIPDPDDFKLDLHGVHSGIVIPDARYDQLAVGNVSRPIDDPSCCQDIVLGGPDSTDVELRFGGGSTERGLTFLEPREPQHWSMASQGQGISDLALADLDADGYNDLVVISSGGKLGVRLGQAGGLNDQYFAGLQTYAVATAAEQPNAMAIGQLDCDDDLDVAVALGSGAVGIVLQTADGLFGKGQVVSGIAAEDHEGIGHARSVAIGDFDGAAPHEIVTANDDGTVTFYRASACGKAWTAVGAKEFYAAVVPACDPAQNSFCVPNTARVHVLTDDVFCNTDHGDLTVGFYDQVRTWCNTDGLDALLSAETWTHLWDLNEGAKPSLMTMQGLVWWPEPASLFVVDSSWLYQLAKPGSLFFDTQTPIMTRIRSTVVADDVRLSHHTAGTISWWQRVTWVHRAETATELGFAR